MFSPSAIYKKKSQSEGRWAYFHPFLNRVGLQQSQNTSLTYL
jgi:hypothetical protein